MHLFSHPFAPDSLVEGLHFLVAEDEPAITIHGYSFYGRFLFTEPAKHQIRNCIFECR